MRLDFGKLKEVISVLLGRVGIVRSQKGFIAGVCAGISEKFGISANFLRLIFIVSTFFTLGMNIIVYYVLAKIMPVKIKFKNVNSFNRRYVNDDYIDVKGREL